MLIKGLINGCLLELAAAAMLVILVATLYGIYTVVVP